MTVLERIRAWDAVQSAEREIVAEDRLPREVRAEFDAMLNAVLISGSRAAVAV